MNKTLEKEKYSSLLLQYQPQVITSSESYNHAIDSIDQLMMREELTPEENILLDLLAMIVEDYEARLVQLEPSPPLDILLHLMEARGNKQADLVGIIGSKGVVSEIVNGKRAISKTQAKKLGDFFNVSPALFI
ncbi:MAG: helix-turn-helix domain-containing protein [Symploca sp. SIO1B1]|nr:helix-turn-helix domain-containing protein [Symploca sp. SIO1A3]NER97754.1 helix-turn-helix domain-containing protein [Symploca sp. SIO1B1]